MRWMGICLAAVLSVATANGALLNLDLEDTPDIAASFELSITDPVFAASGAALEFNDGSATYAILDCLDPFGSMGAFNLQALVDGGGNLLGGSFAVTGCLYDQAWNPVPGSGTLLTGDLTDFGYEMVGPSDPVIFEFAFNVTGGDLSGFYGSTGGILMTAYMQQTQGEGRGLGTCDIKRVRTAVPDGGASLLLLGLGLTGLSALRRAKKA